MSRLKIMVAGMANPHIPGYLRGSLRWYRDLVELVAASDAETVHRERAAEILRAAPEIPVYDDYRAMAEAHPEAEAVIIGSDNCDHFEMFRYFSARKLHIFMMKVPSMDEAECREMIAIAARMRHVVQCELELHFNPQFRYARELVRSGALGELQSVYLSNISHSPCNYFPNWGVPELSYGKRMPLRPGCRICRGGALTDHPHPFDLMRWITGREFATVRAVSAVNQREHLEVEDHAALTGYLDDGTAYFINPSYSNLEEQTPQRRLIWPKALECNLKLTGSKGYFSCDYFDRASLMAGPGLASPDRLLVDQTPRMKLDCDLSLLGSFTAVIAGQRPRPETTLEDAFAAIRVMNCAYESIFRNEEIGVEHE